MKNTDLTLLNIQQQIALNNGSIGIVNSGGSYQFVDSATGKALTNAPPVGNYLLSNPTAVYQTGLRASVYNYAISIFGGKTVPPEVVDTLSAMASYYVAQTGQSVTSLFNNGILIDQFIATINNIRGSTSQIGYAGLNLSPKWSNNPILRANIARAIEPWDATGTYAQRSAYNSKPVGFTYYATDTDAVYEIISTNTWDVYPVTEPIWPA